MNVNAFASSMWYNNPIGMKWMRYTLNERCPNGTRPLTGMFCMLNQSKQTPVSAAIKNIAFAGKNVNSALPVGNAHCWSVDHAYVNDKAQLTSPSVTKAKVVLF